MIKKEPKEHEGIW